MLGAAPNCQNPEFDSVLPPTNIPGLQKDMGVHQRAVQEHHSCMYEACTAPTCCSVAALYAKRKPCRHICSLARTPQRKPKQQWPCRSSAYHVTEEITVRSKPYMHLQITVRKTPVKRCTWRSAIILQQTILPAYNVAHIHPDAGPGNPCARAAGTGRLGGSAHIGAVVGQAHAVVLYLRVEREGLAIGVACTGRVLACCAQEGFEHVVHVSICVQEACAGATCSLPL